MLPDDTLSRILYIDLAKRMSHVENRPDLFEKAIGGAGVAVELLHEECPEGVNPLSPDNPIVLAVGPLVGLYPLASKTVAMFKSPHTGNLGESHAGGRSAVAIRLAGYGAVVIRGASESPVYVAIHGDRVHFRDASTLWGIRSSFTVGRIIREREPNAGLRTIMRIGRAGERLVSYAGVTTETYRHFGRLGLGAVFGSKKLKALVVSGNRALPTADGKQYKKVYEEIYEAAVNSPVMKKYHDLGTAGNVLPLNKLRGMPTRNLRQATFDAAEKISGETFAEHYLGRRVACSHCPVGCIHLAALREPSEHEPYFFKTSMICYDYEPIFALGAMLGGDDPKGLLRLMDAIEVYCLDAMTTGVVLAWATEAMEKGIISAKETAGIALAWGDYAGYVRAAHAIVDQPTEFCRDLARGIEHASAKYGGQDFAMAFGGNEMPGYHTGPAACLNYLTGARHSHLDSAGYGIDQKNLAEGKAMTPEDLAAALVKEEQWRQVLAGLVVCFFARNIYKPDVVIRALQTAGCDMSEDDLNRIGADVLRRKYAFKRREGFDLEKSRIPKRALETPTPLGALSEDFLRAAMNAFSAQVR
ncbi:MAG: aldehyde ferredoxin oxidoreductase family protein [Planctomycetota bacterium]